MVLVGVEKQGKQLQHPKIGIVGLGYVGLPAAICFAEHYEVIGYDIDKNKIQALQKNQDETGEVTEQQLKETTCIFTNREEKLSDCNFIIVAVPTPIKQQNKPDLTFVREATKVIGRNIKKGAIVIYESTVYPGVTEEVCKPILENESGLTIGEDFSVGYSPERINPGDKENTFKTIGKVVSGYDEKTTDAIEKLYASVLDAPVYRATSIKVAEASKVVENTQRDINIAFMNELAMLFDHIDIDTHEVLAACRTKWNFLPFSPGLVGGHCISVDPYYLIEKAEQLGYQPTFIKEARKINASMPQFVVNQITQFAESHQIELEKLKVTILGVTFKENVPDLRNSGTIEIIKELKNQGVQVTISDPIASDTEVREVCGMSFTPFEALGDSNIVLLAVPHRQYMEKNSVDFCNLLSNNKGMLMDLKAVLSKERCPNSIEWWTL